MMKKTLLTMMAAAGMAAMVTTGVMANETAKVEKEGVVFDIPEEFQKLLTVQTEDLSEGSLVRVSETASLDAAQKVYPGEDVGAGLLFEIVRVPEEKMKELRCGGMDGMDVFAEDNDTYLVFRHPTDVRFVREQYENMDEEMELWGKMNEWANSEVCKEILANNEELDEAHFSNTALDMYLARAAYEAGTNFEVKSLEFGNTVPKIPADDDFVKDLAEDFTFEEISEEETPDGEYIVLNFPDDEVRFDFFLAKDGENLVRMVYGIDGDEYAELFKATCKDAEDQKTTTQVMQAWCAAIARANG